MSVINTNVNALYAQDSSSKVGRSLATSMQRLSTGSRINSAKDDAAGLAISTRMTAQTRGLQMAIRNANDGISLMQTTEGALDEVTSILQRMRELAVQSANGVNNGKDRSSIDAEVQQLKTEIDRIATTTKFNDQNLLDGSFTNRQLQIGHKAGETMAVNIESVKTKDLGMAGASFDNKTLVSSRFVGNTTTVYAAGDIMINDQAVATIKANSDIGQVVTAINQSVDNVQASAFNTVKAKSIGSGVVAADGDLQIKVENLGGSGKTTTYSINASANMQQLVENINKQAGAQVSASIDSDGKLVLSNTTGAKITILDKTGSVAGSYDTATGFKKTGTFASAATSASYSGFLKLDSKDGSPIRIDTGNLGMSTPGSMAELNKLGFQQVTSKFDKGLNAYQLTGQSFSTANAAAAWGQTDLTINGVQIYNSAIATTSFQGKLDAINNFSKQTGVVATASFDKTISIDTAHTVTAGAKLTFNGVTVYSQAASGFLSADGVAKSINAKTATTGIKAIADGNNLRLVGVNIQQVKIRASETGGSTAYADTNTTFTGFSTGPVYYGAISLQSVDNTPIKVALGDSATQASTGFLEENVGAADFQVNAPTLGVGAGQSLSGLNVLTSANASTAIGALDNALDKVSALRSKLGAMENRLTHTVDNLTNEVTNTQASRSRIQDTDYATETTALAKSQIISQAATAMLAQANQQPQSVLSLLK
jgi:flagellin